MKSIFDFNTILFLLGFFLLLLILQALTTRLLALHVTHL